VHDHCKSAIANLLASFVQSVHFRIFQGNPRRPESVRPRICIQMVNCGFSFTKLDIQNGESGVKAIEINLSSMFTDRRDDVESHR
jgi:hypothetical protein